MNSLPNARLFWLSQRMPDAIARITGAEPDSDLKGMVRFYQSREGVYVVSNFVGLPDGADGCPHSVFAMHIHSGDSCTGAEEDPFANAGVHYNPQDCPHPDHAGDLLPLFSNAGRAWSAFLTSRFTIADVLGSTVILHANADDFSTQPSGNAGEKLGCGVISSCWQQNRPAQRQRNW